MTYEIKAFYWHSNPGNCIDILNYEFQGVTEVHDDTFFNDESPSCTFEIDGIIYKVFFPSDYKGDYCEFLLLDYTNYDANFRVDILGKFPTISELLNYFKNLNVI